MQSLSQVLTRIEESRKDLTFLQTGFRELDLSLDGGFLRKELVILGGSTGIGKSYMAGQMMANMAKNGYKSAYFSLEISNEMVVSRLVGAYANIKSAKVMTSCLEPYEVSLKTRAVAKLSCYADFLTFYDDIYTLEHIIKEVETNKFAFVVVDFIQNVVVPGMMEYERLSHVALELQKLAKRTNTCILVLSQLSNMVSREKNNPILEYKGSGSIATVADLGFFIQRGDIDINPDALTLLLRKNRRGVSGLAFNLKFTPPGGMIV